VAASQAALIMALLVIAIVVNSLAARLPRVSAAAPQDLLAAPGLHVDVALSAPKIVTAASYCSAVVGFLRRSRRSHDEFSEWLAVAAVLGAAAYVNYLLYPYSSSQLTSIGDAFRLCFYAVVLAGLAREAGSYWRAMSEAAIRQERWRIAADLHDGLAQDIAYLARNLGSMDGAADQETMAQLRQAAERAHLEVRLAIGTLAASRSQSVNAAIAQAVGEVAARDHVKLELDVVPGIRVSATRAEALVRIASEAVGNAARHSGSDSVSVSLQRQGSRVRLRVSDHGTGFDPALPGAGFGLTSMHERASAVGGDLRISSLPGYGTEVEATL
jgi:signal transduction histidine kinase